MQFEYEDSQNWKDLLDRLAAIREQGRFTEDDVEFIRQQLNSEDERLRAAAALAADGCQFEPYVLDMLIQLAESDPSDAVRKAALQSLGPVIYEGIMQDMEDQQGSGTAMDFYEEWDEIHGETLREDYLRVKNLLLSVLQNEFEETGLREAALISLSDAGFLESVQDYINEFIRSSRNSSKLVALHAMGKYPRFWEEALAEYLTPETPKSLLMEAISSSYSSQSSLLAEKLEKLLKLNDPEILTYTLLTLTRINRTEGLGAILQRFSLYPDEKVQKTAKDAIQQLSNRNLEDFLKDELGIDD
ncbi:MAG: HEAT repeat domain-containing protein [Calditrichia bacterium]